MTNERTFYLLTYDIADPKRLAKVAKVMEAHCERVQDSVFEAYLNENELNRLLKKVSKLMEMKKDSLRVYMLCGACRGKIRCIGIGKVTQPPELVIL